MAEVIQQISNECLDSTAIITPSDIGSNLFLYLGPPKMGFQILIHFATTRWIDNLDE